MGLRQISCSYKPQAIYPPVVSVVPIVLVVLKTSSSRAHRAIRVIRPIRVLPLSTFKSNHSPLFWRGAGGEAFSQKPTTAIQELPDAEREQRKAAILQYVAKLARYVSKDWKNRYDTLWKNILSLPEVEAEVYNPGRQKGTTFNRKLIANILYIMCTENVIKDKNATTLAEALEANKEHSVRSQLGQYPLDSDIRQKVTQLIASVGR